MGEPTSEEIIKVFKIIGWAVGGLIAVLGVLWWIVKNVIFRDEFSNELNELKAEFEKLKIAFESSKNSESVALQAQVMKLSQNVEGLVKALEKKHR